MINKTKAALQSCQCHYQMFKQEQNTRISAGGQSLSVTGIPVSSNSTTVQICIVLLDNHFLPLSGSAPGILRGINTEVQIISVRLTYGHRNPLKLFQTVNLQSAQNSLKLLSQLNYREMRELANTLIIPKNTNGAVRLPQIEVLERINNLGFAVNDEVYKFSGEEGKRDSIIVVAQLSPEFTARLVDRWKELEEERSRPKSQAELIAEMALLNVEQERRLYQVEEQVETVVEAVENIKRGNMRAGYVGYRQVVAKSGMTDAKCRNLVNAYRIPTDTHEFMTPDGLLSRRAIVEFEPFMKAFRQMMAEAEPRGTRWYHPKMGLFQAIGWEDKA